MLGLWGHLDGEFFGENEKERKKKAQSFS